MVLINIPSSVTSIGEGAFYDCNGLTSINIPSSVTSIGESAFSGCSGLTSITIPSSVTEIGKDAFYQCESTSISVDKGNTVYDSRDNCNALIETATNTLLFGNNYTVIPSSVTAIADNAFIKCTRLTSVTLPDGLESIGDHAFASCTNLTSVTLPDGLESIGDYAFAGCTNLTSVTLPNGLESIGTNAFDGCSGLTSITIPEGVTEIKKRTFVNCLGLKSVTLPVSIKNIYGMAFDGCTALASMTVLASTPPAIDNEIFYRGVDPSIPIYVPNVADYQSDEFWSEFTSSNFILIDINQYKQAALDEINAAKDGVTLTEDEVAAINSYINTINGVTTLSDENFTTIENAKKNALAIIRQTTIRLIRQVALAAIEAAMQGESGDYLTGLVQQCINSINTQKDVTYINNAKNTALTILNVAVPTYKTIKAEALGDLGTPQTGKAIEVIDQNDKGVILYNPKRVNFINVQTEE